MADQGYTCPCCGYLTLTQPPPGTWEICPVCFWEDTPAGWHWGSNQVSLRQGQTNFETLGACEPAWLEDIRPPTDDEQRLPHWQSWQEQEEVRRTALIQHITTAFSNVLREDGVSLHQARVIDDYGSAEEEAQARLLDTDTHWWEVPEEWIAEYYEILNFVDPKGFRYYIPAYMIWTLNHYKNTYSNTVDSTIYCFLTYGGLEDWSQERFRILDGAQSQVVCLFLRHIVWLGNDSLDADSAQLALDQYWGQYCS